MTIEVLFFAVLRERAGRERETIDLPGAASAIRLTAGQLMELLVQRHPGFAGLESKVQLAVNRQMVPRTHVLADGDEVALIPPVSGGAR